MKVCIDDFTYDVRCIFNVFDVLTSFFDAVLYYNLNPLHPYIYCIYNVCICVVLTQMNTRSIARFSMLKQYVLKNTNSI